jgi:hypothetical protein
MGQYSGGVRTAFFEANWKDTRFRAIRAILSLELTFKGREVREKKQGGFLSRPVKDIENVEI